MSLCTLLTVFTKVKFVIFRMILLFFPAMTLRAFILVWTTILVSCYVFFWAPIRALLFWVLVELRFSPEVLPIMCKNTHISLMFAFIVRAPDSLKMKHIEVYISIKFVNKFHWYFTFRMSKGTELSIFTFLCSINVWWAELCLVFIWMIEFFNSIVSFLAMLSLMTLLIFSSIMTHLWLVYPKRSSLVLFLIMIIWTTLEVMIIRVNLTRIHLE
jgi:hypothetical protein